MVLLRDIKPIQSQKAILKFKVQIIMILLHLYLLYLTVTRPDIQYSINTLSQFIQSPCFSHIQVAKHALRYLKGSVGKGLFLSASNPINLVGYVDLDQPGCPITCQSATGYFTMLGSSPISWKIKEQPIVSHSFVETEYHSLQSLLLSCNG